MEKGFAESDYIREETFVGNHTYQHPMEPHASIATWESDGTLVLYSSTQAPHYVQYMLAHVFHMPLGKIRVIRPTVGGGFGGKAETSPLDLCATILSEKTGRPVKMVYSREEMMHARPGTPQAVHEVQARRRSHRQDQGFRKRNLPRRRSLLLLRRGHHLLRRQHDADALSHPQFQIHRHSRRDQPARVRRFSRPRRAASAFCFRVSPHHDRGRAGDRSHRDPACAIRWTPTRGPSTISISAAASFGPRSTPFAKNPAGRKNSASCPRVAASASVAAASSRARATPSIAARSSFPTKRDANLSRKSRSSRTPMPSSGSPKTAWRRS